MPLIPGLYKGVEVWVTTNIVDLQTMARRLGKNRITVWRKYLHDPTFPKPVMRLGNSDGYYWPHVEAWMRGERNG